MVLLYGLSRIQQSVVRIGAGAGAKPQLRSLMSVNLRVVSGLDQTVAEKTNTV